MMWFKELTGFEESDPIQVRKNISVEGEFLLSIVNGRKVRFGRLEIPTLKVLKESVSPLNSYSNKIQIAEIVGNVQELHSLSENKGAMFQAASQFNLLEMVGPQVTPEMGVSIYEFDKTQGPSCAIACGAGTIYRNYFVDLDGDMGQSERKQIDCLEDIGREFDNESKKYWKMQNGYALATRNGLSEISEIIQSLSDPAYENLKEKLKIGIQWDTEVTLASADQIVSQAYCSALPVAYSHIDAALWRDFANLILEASYEATFYAALQNFENTGNPRLYLTLVGGGAFGNDLDWILNAISKAVIKFKFTPLEVKIVSYRGSIPEIQKFINDLGKDYK
ncbi:MAG: hypothetical protein IPM42_01875 [Saprospiraceae bacterium]|nr:hypothetical protein [Saprospiraceae bacterium]